MSADSVTLAGRLSAEAVMESTCTITRSAPADPAIDPQTGVENPPTVTTIYSGKCRLRFTDARANEVLAAGQTVAVQSPILSIPVEATGSEDVRTDDVVTITANPLDASTVGAALRIAGRHIMTHATARRFPCEVMS